MSRVTSSLEVGLSEGVIICVSPKYTINEYQVGRHCPRVTLLETVVVIKVRESVLGLKSVNVSLALIYIS